MLKRSVLTALVFAGVASGAFAQSDRWQAAPQRPSASPGTPMYDHTNAQVKLWRQSMAEDAQSTVTAAQWRRARKAVALIKANHCEDAYNMALDEQDDRLALNIAVACKARVRQ